MQSPEEQAREITERITKGPEAEAQFTDGSLVQTKKAGTLYRICNVHRTSMGMQATIVRAVPKIKGKAARKADRAARRTNKFARGLR